MTGCCNALRFRHDAGVHAESDAEEARSGASQLRTVLGTERAESRAPEWPTGIGFSVSEV